MSAPLHRPIRKHAVPILRQKRPALTGTVAGLWHSFGHVQPLDSQRALLRKAFDPALPTLTLPTTTALRAALKRILAACCGRILPAIVTS